MNRFLLPLYYVCCILVLISCGENANQNKISEKDTTDTATASAADENKSPSGYAGDREFLKKYVSVVELQKGSSRVLIVPRYQARVMTSTCKGDSGYSFGWVNYDLIRSKKLKDHINPFGGEERLWLAPEGGQFSFFFKKDVPYVFDNWFTPKEFDTESFDISSQSDTSVLFKKDIVLNNRSGNSFAIHIDRKISLLDRKKIEENLKIEMGSDVEAIGYESSNTLVNSGKSPWTKKTGAPAVWLLGMLKPSPNTTIVLPIRKNASDTTALVHDKYFGAIPSDRWKVEGDHAYLKADGKFRGKVGIPPQHATNFIGSYNAQDRVLTLLQCTWPKNAEFVNSAWEEQKDPFSGDAFNAYNDGPLKDGSQLGPFYEVESLSPAAFLSPGKSLTHTQITYHLQGDEKVLNKIAEQILGVGLQSIQNAFKTN
jgi:hypothetical protein